MTGNNSAFLVVTGSIASQLQNFSCQVFQNSCKVDWSTSTNSLGVVAFSQKSVDTSDWELKSSTG